MRSRLEVRVILLCAFAVAINVFLGSAVTLLQIPLIYFSGMGTIFIGVNFKMKYGVMTGLATHMVLAMLYGPASLAFGLSSMVNAIVANLGARRQFTISQAILTGILISLIGSLVSVCIRLALYGGLSNSITDVLIFAVRSSGATLFLAAYIGAVTDTLLDKILSCLIVRQLSKLPQMKRFAKTTFANQSREKEQNKF